MRIAFEGPKHTLVDFDNILNIFKEEKIVVFYCTPNKKIISTCILRNIPMLDNY